VTSLAAALSVAWLASSDPCPDGCPPLEARVQAVVKTIQPQLDRCSKLASARGQMGDVIVWLDKARSKHVRRQYRAIGVDGDVLACVRKAVEDQVGLLTGAGLDIPVDHYSYREDIPLGENRRFLFPVRADFFEEWDRHRRDGKGRWSGVPAGVEMTPEGCLVLPQTRRLGSAHMSWRVEMGKCWPRVDPAEWRQLQALPDEVIHEAVRVRRDLALVMLGRKVGPWPVRREWGDRLGDKICLQPLAAKDGAGGPISIKVTGTSAQLAGLPSTPGVHVDDHGVERLGRDRWSVTPLFASREVIDVLRGRGLQVEVLLDEVQFRARGCQIAREVEGADAAPP